jgi:hypothetical protein
MSSGFEYYDEICSECGYYMAPDGECLECMGLRSEEDPVAAPSHYANYAIEPIEYIMKNEMEFWRGNIVKYASRAGYKQYDGLTLDQSEIRDLEKIIQYAKFRINELETKDMPF